MQYDHTQRGGIHIPVYLTAGLCLLGGWLCREELALAIILAASGAVILPLGMCFHWLRVRDEDEHLDVRFGPLPLFGTRIPYDKITDVQADRSTFLDGWGVHWMPGKGFIYNVWGFDCIRVTLGQKTVRVGTDDIVNLRVFLRLKMRQSDAI